MEYPYATIQINGREVLLEDILHQKTIAKSAFEKNTFHFIRLWLTGCETFHLKTSGSTGEPKIITLTRQQMEASASLSRQALELKTGYNALVCLDTRYIAGQMMLVRSFITGMRIICADPSANPFEKLPQPQSVDFIALVPYQVYHILESPFAFKLNEVRTVIIGGAWLENSVVEKLKPYKANFFATYGMTETISHVALQRLNGSLASDEFHTLPGIEVNVDSRGCLIIQTPYTMTALVTNDLVELISPSRFKWRGRWDNIINTGGVKVSPEKIESDLQPVFAALNMKQRYLISSEPDRYLGNKIVLVIEASVIDNTLTAKMFNRFPGSLSTFEIPKSIVGLYPFPETDTGKIKREEVRNMLTNRPHR